MSRPRYGKTKLLLKKNKTEKLRKLPSANPPRLLCCSQRAKADFVVKEMDRKMTDINRIVNVASSNAVISDAMARAGLSGALASSVANFKVGALPFRPTRTSEHISRKVTMLKLGT